jgi:SAM-dependent methyltransferase
MTSLNDVHSFWESNPLWTGESDFEPGTQPFFDEHRNVYVADCFAGNFDLRFLPPPRNAGQKMKILDLGCGIGFWVTEFALRGLQNLLAADLTQSALDITAKRLEAYGVSAELSRQNAEQLTFDDSTIDHINCQGVIHHTPDTARTISEMARVLKSGGTASISVYYRNSILKAWPYLRWLGWPLAKLGGGLKGRGRESIFLEKDVDQIVRLYDGSDNPIGKSYTKEQFVEMLQPHFIVQETYLHFFPARALPFKLPGALHRWLDRNLGFMIYATLRKA